MGRIAAVARGPWTKVNTDRKSTRLNSSHVSISYAVFCLKKKNEAAYAAEAAGLQGHFWEMHDLLYREQLNWPKTKYVQPLFSSYAGMLVLNLDRFRNDSS